MEYHDMIVEASDAELVRTEDKQRLGRFKVRVIHSPAGGMKPEEAVAVTYDDKQLQARLRQLEKRQLDPPALIALGRSLAQWLLPPGKADGTVGVRELFAASLVLLGQDGGVRLRLRLPPMLAALPWEYMYIDRAGGGDAMDGFAALDPRLAIVRHEVLPVPAQEPLVVGDVRITVALASAAGLPPLDLDQEKVDLQEALTQPGIEPTFLEDATLDEVQAALPRTHVFHFAGHGKFTRQLGDLPGSYTGTGALALDDQDVGAEQLGINLRGNGVRLAVLGGCDTGRRDGVSVWSGIAPALVKAEIPAVVANQYSIRDPCAIAFSRQFYRALVGGLSIERAVTAGRIAAYNEDRDGRDWGVPVLYMRAADGRLFEGAEDREVRQQAQAEAAADVNVRVREIAAGGRVLGAEVREMVAGKLAVSAVVDGVVYGELIGAVIEQLGAGKTRVDTRVDTVGEGGKVAGAKIDRLG